MVKYGGKVMKEVLGVMFRLFWRLEKQPEDWKKGDIFPIYKKGEVTDIGNYRGITLLSVVGKMMEAIVNRRVSKWIEEKKRLSDEQGGFRTLRGCQDLMFLLMMVLGQREEKKEVTYACFIDVTKAYDTVWQDGLWKKLADVGVVGKAWRFIKEWYRDMKSTVLVDGKRTREFGVGQGVKQGAVMSPLLYAIFVDGVVDALQKKGLGVVMDGIWVGAMLYADDMALLARTAEELQEMIDVVVEYSRKWRFELSWKKSEVMVVGGIKKKEKWTMGGQELKVVTEFKYLGVEFQRNGRWAAVCKRLCDKANKKVQVLIGLGMRDEGFSAKTGASLWSSLVAPMLEYGSEVWEPGKTDVKRVEKVQLAAGKSILGCGSKMANEVVRGELGWMTMAGRRAVMKMRFFGRLVRMDEDRVVRKVFVKRYRKWKAGEGGWFGNVKEMMEKSGIGDWWDEGTWEGMPEKAEWDSMVMEGVRGEEVRRWKEGMADKGTLENYRRIKTELELEDYLVGARGRRPGVVLITKLRGGTNALRVSQGRHSNLPRHERLCLVCNSGKVEDEFHFVMECPDLAVPRAEMWQNIENAVSDELGIALNLQLMTEQERFDMLLGKKQPFEAPNTMAGTIARGLVAMYEARKGCLYEDIFQPKRGGWKGAGSG
jgi:hypothetical protein